MKELIRSNLAMQQLGYTSEVARRTPRMVDIELTSSPFPPTLGRERNIFMSETGNGEIPTGNVSKEPRVPRPEQGKPLTPEQKDIVEGRWKRDYLKGRDLSSLPLDEKQIIQIAINAGLSPAADEKSTPHTLEEKERMFQTAEALQKLVGTPEFERQTKELAKKTPEQALVKEKREESKGVVAYGQLGGEGGPRRSIFEGIPLPDRDRELARELQIRGRALTDQELADFNRDFEQRARGISPFREALIRADNVGMLNVPEEYNRLNDAIRRNELNALDAQQYLDQLAERYMDERLIRQGVDPRVQEIRAARAAQNLEEERRLLNEMIREFDADSTRSISIQDFRVIAEDEEAAEKLLDKIISKPLINPTDHYELSFYAGINLQTFLSEVRAIDEERNEERFKRYAELRAATLIFHEMNRGITVESGNISAFLSLTRSVNPTHLQTATQLDGVESVRQLTEEAIGRLYTERSETIGDKVDPEINEWVRGQFYNQVGYEKNEQGRWVYVGRPETPQTEDVLLPAPLPGQELAPSPVVTPTGEVIRSKYGRPLEPWEIERALAFGRNIHASFYRKSALYSWSSVPLPWQGWLNAPPTETVLKVLAGLKWEGYRYRKGETGGGPELVALLYDNISKEYRDKNPELKKIGQLDILKDILPTGFFNGDGFDSGWRVFHAYLGSDVMKVRINPDMYSNSSDSIKSAIREFLQKKRLPEEGGDVNLGEFIIEQENKAKLELVRGVTVGGAQVPPETLPADFPGIQKQMKQVIEPIMDQINLSLGVLIKYGGSNEALKARLWEKTADLLPLRTAYLLSEEGVKNLPGYNNVRGEDAHLFSDDFESKLIKAQHLRIGAQKRDTTKTPVRLDHFLNQVGMVDEEKQFVARLQGLGREKALELAKISFPHIPFMEDVPFGEAKYTELPSEVFPRRMGGDFEGFYKANGALGNIIGDLAQPYPRILENLKGIKDGITDPEGPRTAQDKVLPILQSYLKLAEQWVWTRWIPFAKTTRGFLNLPTSWLQVKFGREALSTDESTMNQMVNEAVGIGAIRREKLPGEDKSQFDQVAEHVGAKPWNVTIDQLRTVSVIVAFIMMGAFVTITGKQLGEELRK